MKKNISVIKTLALLLTAGAIMTACTNDELVEPTQTAKTYTLTVNAVSAGANGTTRALSLDGKTLNAVWATDESVYVTYEGGSALQGTLHPSSNGTSTILKGTLNSRIQVGKKLSLTYPCGTIYYRGQVGTLEDISARYSFATATATVTSINSAEGKMVADNGEGGPVIFENRQAVVKFSLVDKATGEALSASKLFVKVDNKEYDVTPEAPASELFVAIQGISGKDVTLNATVGDDAYSYEQKGVTFENSRYYAVTVKMTKAYRRCPDDHHPHAINLGLPSGTKWCCCNVGASTPEGYGGYYAWGETSEKSVYDWNTYAYYNIGSDIAGTQYDAATANMGAPWRMPSFVQQQELISKCFRQWTQQNGVNGILVTGPNGGQIFLPAAGYRWNGNLSNAGSYGYYWSSSLHSSGDYYAYILYFDSGTRYWSYYGDRRDGQSVRAVCP